MYSLSIHFGPSQMCWMFLFKDKQRAEFAYKQATGNELNIVNGINDFLIVDDFGQSATFRYISVHGVLLEDMDLSQEALIQRVLHQTRGQAKAQSRAGQDATLKALNGMRGGLPNLSQFNTN